MRLIWIAVTSVAISLAVASCGGVPEDTGTEVDPVDQGVIQAPPAATAGAGTTKVTICHIPPGNPANAHTITVGAPAVRAHLRHGDTIGPCGGGGGGGGEGDGGCGGGGGGEDGGGGGGGEDGGGGGGGEDGGGGGGEDGGVDGGGGQCRGSGALCGGPISCCAGWTCVDADMSPCFEGTCTCQVVVN